MLAGEGAGGEGEMGSGRESGVDGVGGRGEGVRGRDGGANEGLSG